MDLLHRYLFTALWGAWCAYWFVSSFSASRPKRVQGMGVRRAHLAAFLAAFALLSYPSLGYGILGQRILLWSEALFVTGASLTAAGLAFAVWARVHLGQYWSGTVTLKEGHRLIRTGPYKHVRHPIYTGLILAFIGSAVAVDAWRGALAVVIVVATLVPKYRLEERWLTEEFGEGICALQARGEGARSGNYLALARGVLEHDIRKHRRVGGHRLVRGEADTDVERAVEVERAGRLRQRGEVRPRGLREA